MRLDPGIGFRFFRYYFVDKCATDEFIREFTPLTSFEDVVSRGEHEISVAD